jgi:hypothetical protein
MATRPETTNMQISLCEELSTTREIFTRDAVTALQPQQLRATRAVDSSQQLGDNKPTPTTTRSLRADNIGAQRRTTPQKEKD